MIFDNYDKNIWHDSSIEKIIIEYNDIVVELETHMAIEKLVFKNYIAFDYIGQWDECIIKSIYEERDNDIIKCALEKVNMCNNTKFKGGGVRDINSDWVCVIIQLIDDVYIRIVCNNVIFE